MSELTSDRSRKRPASPGLVVPSAQRRQNPATASRLLDTVPPVSAAEHKEGLGAFANSVSQGLVTEFNKAHFRDMVDLGAAGVDDDALWEGLSFIFDIWDRQVFGACSLAEMLRHKADQTKQPSSAAWHRRWLDRNSSLQLFELPGQSRMNGGRPALRLGMFGRGQSAPDGHSDRVESMTAQLRCCLEETVIRHFHNQMARLKAAGKNIDTVAGDDKAPHERAVECFVRRFSAITALVAEARERCTRSPQELDLDRLYAWIGTQQHLKLKLLPVLMAYHAPTEGILRVTELLEAQRVPFGTNQCFCNDMSIHTSYFSRKKKYQCRYCECIRCGLPCSSERCRCPENCGNPYNSLGRVFGPAEPPIAPSDCLKDWLRDRNPVKKPLETSELFDIVYPQLEWFTIPDVLLDQWKDAWAGLENRPKHDADRQAHMQLLVRIAAARDYPGRNCMFSFCIEDLGTSGWYRIGSEWRGHCSLCGSCQPAGTWHCSKCPGISGLGICLGNKRDSPCFACGGVSLDYLKIRRGNGPDDGTSVSGSE